ncbi:SlyX family protein [Kerstersia sp.]|uniref:SlyX family protein n=1 Tax=Kerstersia sp. TaxID=1930783 RepID=UPI003F902F88
MTTRQTQTPSAQPAAGAEGTDAMSLALAVARIQELEIRSALAEDLVEQLNQQMFRMQRQLDALQRQLIELRDQVPAEGVAFRSLRDELPPHY